MEKKKSKIFAHLKSRCWIILFLLYWKSFRCLLSQHRKIWKNKKNVLPTFFYYFGIVLTNISTMGLCFPPSPEASHCVSCLVLTSHWAVQQRFPGLSEEPLGKNNQRKTTDGCVWARHFTLHAGGCQTTQRCWWNGSLTSVSVSQESCGYKVSYQHQWMNVCMTDCIVKCFGVFWNFIKHEPFFEKQNNKHS